MPFFKVVLTTVLACAVVACDTDPDDAAGNPPPASDVSSARQAFAAQLSPVNAGLLGSSPSGETRLEIHGDSMTITIDTQGVPPGMVHLQHFHGFEDGAAARCPGSDADQNGDGVVDVVETAPMAGTTMLPFHGEPRSMEIAAETYPRAGPDGSYTYRRTVALDELRLAFREKFGGDLHLDRRVVFIHSVPEDLELPVTAETKAGLSAHTTLPIACGELRPAGGVGAGY